MPQVFVNGVNLYYEVAGQGEPVVLIPGFGAGMWIWFKQIPTFSKNYQTIVFDNRGVGKSDKPLAPYSVAQMAADVAGLLTTLGVTRAHILGASMGGFIAQEFALTYPQLTRSLVLCCTSFGGPNHVPPGPETLAAFGAFQGLNLENRIRQNFHLAFSAAYERQHPAEVEAIIQMRINNPVPEHASLNQLQAAMGFNIEARVSQITAPTLIITGDHDLMVPPQNSHNLAAKMPQAEIAVIAGAGHSVFIEETTLFNKTVQKFWQSIAT
jgi:pimeloyl-ACP methyl ester carboxylesterase